MKKRNVLISFLLIISILVGCSGQKDIDTNSEKYKELYESNLSEVEKLKSEIDVLKDTNENLSSELNRYGEANQRIKDLENEIITLKAIIEKGKSINTNSDDGTDILSTEELRRKTYEAATIYQKYFFLSSLKHHDDVAKEESDLYKTSYENNDELDGYYLVTEENINTSLDFVTDLEKYYTREAIYDFLDVHEKDDMTILNNGGYIEYNGRLFTDGRGGIGVLAYDQVRFAEAEFQFCGETKDKEALMYKMILPTAHYHHDDHKLEKVTFDESFIEMVKTAENEWRLNKFIIIEDYISEI